MRSAYILILIHIKNFMKKFFVPKKNLGLGLIDILTKFVKISAVRNT